MVALHKQLYKVLSTNSSLFETSVSQQDSSGTHSKYSKHKFTKWTHCESIH